MENRAYEHMERTKKKGGIPYKIYSPFPESEEIDAEEKYKILTILFRDHPHELFKIGFREEKSSYPLVSFASVIELLPDSRVHLGVYATSTPIHYIMPFDMIEYIGSEEGEEYYKRKSVHK